MINTLDERMLAVMTSSEVKEAGLQLTLTLTDGTTRSGIYQDLVINPLNRFEFRDTWFIKFLSNRPTKGVIVYLPITLVATVEWSQ